MSTIGEVQRGEDPGRRKVRATNTIPPPWPPPHSLHCLPSPPLTPRSFGKALLVKVKGTNKFFVMKEIQIGHLSKKEKEASVAEATVLAR